MELGLAAWRSFGLLLAERVDALEQRMAELEAATATSAPSRLSPPVPGPGAEDGDAPWRGLLAALFRSGIGAPRSSLEAPAQRRSDDRLADGEITSVDPPPTEPEPTRSAEELDALLRPDPTIGFWDELLGVRRQRRG